MVKFDPTIDLGTVISGIVLLIGSIRIFMRIGAIETKVEAMWDKYVNEHDR